MNKPKLFCMVGLSASGKSTIGKEIEKENDCVIVSSDDIRGEICEGGVIDQSKNEEVFKIFHQRIKDNLKAGKNVIADATNINMRARRSLLENVKKVPCHKIAYIIPKSVEQCIEDNIYKEYPVPHHVIQKQMMNFQIPFVEEGFDEIIYDGEIVKAPQEGISVYSTDGRLILATEESTVGVSSLSNGVYIVKSGSLTTKIVK